ncbi:MAG: TolC family protein [Candidatus Nitrosotenuis sp.]
MDKAKILLVLILFVSIINNVYSEDGVFKLSLNDAIKMAIEKNLDIRVESFNVAQFEVDAQRSWAIYDPTLAFKITYDYTYSPANKQATDNLPPSSTNFLSPSMDKDAIPRISEVTSTEVETIVFNSSLSQLLRTGGTLSAVFNNTYTNTITQSTVSDYNYWQINVGFNFTQPLLKNFGRENTELNISTSYLSKEASIERFRNFLSAIVSQVCTEYFKLYSLNEKLKARKTSLELAHTILNETNAKNRAGILPSIEILNAEFGVALREKELIEAEKDVKNQIDSIKLLLQLTTESDIEVVDLPKKEFLEVNEIEAIHKALNRYDILEQKKNLEITKLQSRVYKNNILPDLSLFFSTYLTSIDSSYLGPFEDTPAWGVGLNLTYPLGNTAAVNDYHKSLLKTEQLTLKIRSLEENAKNDVRSAIRDVTSRYKQIEVTERGMKFAEERFRAFRLKYDVGLATVKDILEVESDLVDAKYNHIQAIIDYNNAIIHLWTITGEILDKVGIRIDEGYINHLYKSVY